MRIFLAIKIPDRIKKNLVKIQEDLEPRIPGVRWESPEKLHLTLVFLGRVSEERIVELEKTVRKGIKGTNGVNVGLSGVGVFPRSRPRVVLVEIGEGREEIEGLQKSLAEALSEANFSFAKLSKPHVTLGRFRRRADATRRVNQDSTLRVGSFGVEEVVIMESQLHPAGAVHTPIARIPLREKV